MGIREQEKVALRDVYLTRIKAEGASEDFPLRKVFREYSKVFHTPLHVVHELPIDFVLRAYLEEVFESYSDEELTREVQDVLRDPEELARAQRDEDAQDAETWDMIQEEKRNKKNVAKVVKKIEDVVSRLNEAATIIRDRPPSDKEPEIVTKSLPAPMKLPEGIQMRFDPDLDLDSIDAFGLLDDPRGPSTKG